MVAAGSGLPAPGGPAGALAQEPALRGRVLVGPDSLPLAGAEVSLHAVGRDTGAVVRRDSADQEGRFTFRVPPADSGTLFLVTVRHDGVLYHGPPFHRASRAPEPYRVMAYPTRAVEGPTTLPVRRRHLILQASGNRLRVVDMARVANDSAWTWTSSTSGPVWSLSYPPGASDVTAAPGGAAGRTVRIVDGRAEVHGAVPPGGARLVLRYGLPAGEPITLSVDRPVASLDLLVEEGVEVSAEDLEPREPVTLEGSRYRRYSARDLPAGASVRFTASPAGAGADAGERSLLPWILVALGAALLAAAAWVRRRLRPSSGSV